ncbi:hypothetical protein BgiMline_036271, partial [Biomphalaria glabrata]
VDAKTGNVIADVKQEVKQEATGNSKPETIVKTKIDIPSEDVHETFVQEGTVSDLYYRCVGCLCSE